jgi:hypothetical protein
MRVYGVSCKRLGAFPLANNCLGMSVLVASVVDPWVVNLEEYEGSGYLQTCADSGWSGWVTGRDLGNELPLAILLVVTGYLWARPLKRRPFAEKSVSDQHEANGSGERLAQVPFNLSRWFEAFAHLA